MNDSNMLILLNTTQELCVCVREALDTFINDATFEYH